MLAKSLHLKFFLFFFLLINAEAKELAPIIKEERSNALIKFKADLGYCKLFKNLDDKITCSSKAEYEYMTLSKDYCSREITELAKKKCIETTKQSYSMDDFRKHLLKTVNERFLSSSDMNKTHECILISKSKIICNGAIYTPLVTSSPDCDGSVNSSMRAMPKIRITPELINNAHDGSTR